ncbi:unnamed protein product [Rotaria sp. Silwood2]|nr:unnamed protein product [Rotaria sp. Silwood2]CAF2840665.1 unnamed protein product [Rotaria sp. Silwood2]CAF3165089.1 unnamed protein product [Rotaria sp. Silwood2]CAF4178108.1 unnamed protein product [Rotaria sp. Silwood2]CAF4231486.1 unnamed protein product [Rotaria sp. Silwood2]
MNLFPVNDHQQEDVKLNIDSNLIYDDNEDESLYLNNDILLEFATYKNESEYGRTTNSLLSTANQEKKSVSMLDIKQSYVSFILQLREEFFLPKNITNAISSYIVTLINHLEVLFEAQTRTFNYDNICSTAPREKPTVETIELNKLQNIMKNVCYEIQNITKNEYQFIKNCEEYFDYIPPKEIIISANNEELEQAYFIPIDKTLSLMLRSQLLLTEILQNIQQQRIAVKNDDNLMLSYRDGSYGSRIDDDSLLIQLYIDDIGVTNPIGAKKDQHKLSMIYFSLEDLPDQYRSQLDFINLVGICQIPLRFDTPGIIYEVELRDT